MILIDKLKGAVDGAVGTAVGTAKTTVGGHADTINSVIDTVTSTADSRTGGKFADRISKFTETAKGGVSSFGTAAESESEVVDVD